MKTTFYISCLLLICLCSCTGSSFLQQRYTNFGHSKTKKPEAKEQLSVEQIIPIKTSLLDTEVKDELLFTSFTDKPGSLMKNQKKTASAIVETEHNSNEVSVVEKPTVLKLQFIPSNKITNSKRVTYNKAAHNLEVLWDVLKIISWVFLVMVIIMGMLIILYLGLLTYAAFIPPLV